MDVGARIWNLGRLLNLREGLRAADDSLPERILSVPHPDGGAAGKVLGAAAFDAAVREYFAVRGWDADGVPTEETLDRLGVDVRL
jgi:aldehyde:ferredoxin oxidoreductase